MHCWLVKLFGHPADLEHMRAQFPEGDVYLMCDADGTYLVCKPFDTMPTAADVYQLARETLDTLRSIASLENATPDVSIDSVLQCNPNGSRLSTVFAEVTGVLARARLTATGVVVGKASAPSGPTLSQQLLAASANPAAGELLKLWSAPGRSWPRLRRIVEEIEHYIGTAPHEVGLCTKTDQARFERSCNSPEVAGVDAAHRAKFQPPSRPMSLDEATTFVGRLISKALRHGPRNK